MLRVDAEVGALNVRNASNNVISLVEREIIHARRNRGTADCGDDQQEENNREKVIPDGMTRTPYR